MREGIRTTPVISPLQHAVDRFRIKDAVQVNQFVVGAFQATFRAGAVVTHDVDEQRVVEFADFVDGVDESADLDVRVLGKSGEGLHLQGE